MKRAINNYYDGMPRWILLNGTIGFEVNSVGICLLTDNNGRPKGPPLRGGPFRYDHEGLYTVLNKACKAFVNEGPGGG